MRKKDVVNVNPDARLKTRQDFEKLVTNVAAKLHCVAGIDEENVVGFETREELDVDLFDSLCNQFDFETRAVQSLLRVRLDTRELSFLVGRQRLARDAC